MAKVLVIKFVTDMAKASADIKKFSDSLNRAGMRPQRIPMGSYGTTQSAISAINAVNQERIQKHFEKLYSGGGNMPSGYGGGGIGSFRAGNMLGPNPRAMVEARLVKDIAPKMSMFSKLLEGINPKLANFLSSTGLISPELARIVGGFGKLGLQITLVVAALKAWKFMLENIFKQGNILEQSKITLKAVYGNEKQAVSTLRSMREFSRKTQFSPDEVMGPTTRMAMFGLDPFKKGSHGLSKDKHLMDLFGGMAAMPGMKNQQLGLDRIVNSVVAGRDIRPIKALGPEAMAAWDVAKGSGKAGSAAFTKTLITELAKVPKYMALANEQMNSMKGMWSTIAGYTEEIFMDISGAGEQTGVITFWSQIKDILMDIRDAGDTFVKYIGPYMVEFGAFIGGAFKYLWDIIKQIALIIAPIIIPAFKIMVQIFRIAWEISRAFMDTLIKIGKIAIAIVTFPLRMIAALFGVSLKLDVVIRKLMDFVAGLQATFVLFKIWMEGVTDAIIATIDKVIAKFQKLVGEYPMLMKFLNGIGTLGLSEIGKGGVIEIPRSTSNKLGEYSPRALLNKMAPETFDAPKQLSGRDTPSMLLPNDPNRKTGTGWNGTYIEKQTNQILNITEPKIVPVYPVPNANRK